MVTLEPSLALETFLLVIVSRGLEPIGRSINQTRTMHSLSFIMIALSATGLAQQPGAGSIATVATLVHQLEDKNEQVVGEAARELTKRGRSVAPALVVALHERRGCQMQWVASGILDLDELDLEPQLVTTTLMNMAKGNCGSRSETDRLLQRQAALAVVSRVEAIPVMARMLSDRDVFIRRSAAFAFDELTERLQGRPPEIEATKEMLDATRNALPFLLEAAMHDQDEIVHCMSYESLDQARRSTHDALRADAVTLLEGKTFPCKR
jgi:HEAT repeat protein